jgi:hypothetical protein
VRYKEGRGKGDGKEMEKEVKEKKETRKGPSPQEVMKISGVSKNKERCATLLFNVSHGFCIQKDHSQV